MNEQINWKVLGKNKGEKPVVPMYPPASRQQEQHLRTIQPYRR